MFRKSLQKLLLVLGGMVWLLSWFAIAQTAAKKAKTEEDPSLVLESTKGYRTTRYQSNNRPDPFLNPLAGRKNENPDEEMPRGNPPLGIAGMFIKDVDLIGISANPEGQTAVFRGTDKRVYFMHAGDRLFDGYITSVSLDAVQLIRETKMRSGKVVTQEVTKRLRTP